MRTRGANERCYVCGAAALQGRVLIDIDEAADLARCSRSTIERRIRQSRLECAKLATGETRIYLDSLFRDPPFREFDLRPLDVV
ncbi:MAG: hypothetical protein EHM18_13200 [Acidobacteria bacterium]|nr:MAG: hypothetical protein EHM18_13200 [Acidobacteriota bacterium]